MFIFSNAHSLRRFDLSYLNSMKLAYQALLGSDLSAWPWKLREYLKHKQHFESKNWPKGLWIYLPKRTTTNAKFLTWGKSQFFCKIISLLRHCKHLQRSQSDSVEQIFAPLLEKISGLTLVPNDAKTYSFQNL